MSRNACKTRLNGGVDVIQTYMVKLAFFEEMAHCLTLDSTLYDLQKLLEHISSSPGVRDLEVFLFNSKYPYQAPPVKLSREELLISNRPAYIPKVR
jgi:hypothetical protein